MNRSLLVLSLLAGCPKESSAPVAAGAANLADTSPEAIGASIESTLDRKTAACDDFYQFSCGGWLANTQIPADRSRYARGFSTIDERNQAVVREILEKGGNDARLDTFFRTCMDEAGADAAGLAPIKPHLDAISKVKDAASLMSTLPVLPLTSPFFDGAVDADFDDPNLNILHVSQGGLGLPERSYYFPEDDAGKALLADYQKHVGQMLARIGFPEDAAAKVIALETALAKASLPPEAMRDPKAIYHRIERKGLQALTPKLPWDTFFAAAGVPGLTAINVATPDFFPAMQAVVDGGDWSAIRAYLAWHLLADAAPYLTKDVDDANFAFYGTRLMGTAQQLPRWKRCVESTDGALGDLLGEAYVERAFPGDSKAKALSMIGDIQASFEKILPNLAWMDDATRAGALKKLASITNKIGYPDKWEAYEGLKVEGTLFDVMAATHNWKVKDSLADAGKPVDKSKWFMSPPTVNAYYNPLINEIVFPAGILQPPFFSAAYPAAINYGAMGMVMGHEVTHGFDDSGRQFAWNGRLEDWWAPETSQRFEERAECVVKLYDGYEGLPGQFVNGELTLGENIADLGGLKLAFKAYKQWKDAGNTDPTYAGFTSEQLFFIGYAQSWCTLSKPELDAVRLKTDPHSPPKFRVNGPLSQMPAFHKAFDCAEGTPMHPKETCEVW